MADEQPATLAHAPHDHLVVGSEEDGPPREPGGDAVDNEDEAGGGARGGLGGAGAENRDRTKARKGRADVPYTIPEWSAAPSVKFHLEVLKNGSVLGDWDL